MVCRPFFVTFCEIQFFLQKSSFVIVREQRRIVCSGLEGCHIQSYIFVMNNRSQADEQGTGKTNRQVQLNAKQQLI